MHLSYCKSSVCDASPGTNTSVVSVLRRSKHIALFPGGLRFQDSRLFGEGSPPRVRHRQPDLPHKVSPSEATLQERRTQPGGGQAQRTV